MTFFEPFYLSDVASQDSSFSLEESQQPNEGDNFLQYLGEILLYAPK